MPKRKLDPLPSAAFHILVALADKDLHGYGIMRRVRNETGGRVQLGPATLYGSIKSLLEAEFIEELDERVDPELGDERRRYYRITSTGCKAVRSEVERLSAMLRVAKSKKTLRGVNV